MSLWVVNMDELDRAQKLATLPLHWTKPMILCGGYFCMVHLILPGPFEYDVGTLRYSWYGTGMVQDPFHGPEQLYVHLQGACGQNMMFDPIGRLLLLPSCSGHIQRSSFFGGLGQ